MKTFIVAIILATSVIGSAGAAEICPYGRYLDGEAKKKEVAQALGVMPCSGLSLEVLERAFNSHVKLELKKAKHGGRLIEE